MSHIYLNESQNFNIGYVYIFVTAHTQPQLT